ncbi:MAG: hypothetical protein AAFZ63_21165 [Bacteroidota bacterium]
MLKNSLYFVYLVAVLSILSGFVKSRNHIRLNGLYVVDNTEEMLAVMEEKRGGLKPVSLDEDIKKYYKYLRFYEDGTAVGVTSTGTPRKVVQWLNKEHEDISSGTYQVRRDSVFMTLTNTAGSVVYKGWISGRKIRMSTESLINGYKGSYVYKFKKIRTQNKSD